MSSPNLVDLARDNDIETLERVWGEQLTSPGDPAAYRKTLEVLCDNDMASRALALASAMIDALVEAGRKEDAAELAMASVARGAHNDALSRRLYGLLQELHGSEPWFEVVRELAGLDPEAVTSDALIGFARMRSYTVGNVLYHRAGWGEGVVEEFRADSREVVVRFARDSTRELPLSTALDSLTPLDKEDLRCMILTDMEELQRLAEQDPSALVRKAARIYRDTITSAQVKGLLSPAIVPTKKWASFWKRAKAAAAIDPWLQVEGSTTRPVFVLRKQPLSLGDEARRAVISCDGLGDEIAMLRDYIERASDPQARQSILDIVQERIELALAAGSGASHAHILDGILLLEEHDRDVPAPAAGELRQMLLGEDGALDPVSFDRLATQDAREHAVKLIPDALGDAWVDLCVDNMTRFPASVVERVVDLVVERGHADRLVSLWNSVAPYPRRHPFMTYLLGRLFADGGFDGTAHAPHPTTVVRVLLHLARVLSADRRGSQQKARLLTRVVSLLTGRREFLVRALVDVEKDDLAVFLGIAERGGEDFPPEILTPILRTVAEKAPELTARAETPFWEHDVILTTREGLERKRDEYRLLVDVKIPENSKAIGVAASHGDLSENSEWDAAMEEQRNLTARAKEAKQELERVKLIEDCTIPDGVVAPGTRVTWKGPDGTHTMRILGPWDVVESDVINYLAPIADDLLGRRIGERARMPSVIGEIKVEVLAVEKLF